MVGVLIEMRAAIQRKNAQGKKAWGLLALVVLVLALAGSTFATGLTHYAHDGAGADVLATLSFGWLLGWVTGPVLTGDDATLRLDYFKLLPVPPRKLANAILGANFANVSLVFSLIAFAGMIAYGAQFSIGAALVGVLAVVLNLVLAVVASTVGVGVLGPTISSRRGRDFGSMLVALVITLMSLASAVVPFLAKKLTDGHSPVLAGIVRGLPSGWGADSVQEAADGHWGLVALPLAGLVVLIGALVLVWPPVLARRLTMSAKGNSKPKAPAHERKPARPILPNTPTGAVIGKELRMYSRSMLRSVQLMIAFLVGVLACVIPSFNGTTIMLPFGGPLFTIIAAACFTNLYGDDGSALWLTLTTPNVEDHDVRGRQWAWFLVAGPIGLVLTVFLTAISGEHWAWPWVLAGEIALVAGGTGMTVLVSVLTMFPLSQDGSPTPQRQAKANLMLFGIPLVCCLPSVALLVVGTVADLDALKWAAVPVGLVWGVLLCRQSGRTATRRLRTRGPELFSLVRQPAS
jgi:ABC-2 type transport system permease protein